MNNLKFDFVGANNNTANNTAGASLPAKLGALDFMWVGVNPTAEEYKELVEKYEFRDSEKTYEYLNSVEYIKDTDYGRYLRIELYVTEAIDEAELAKKAEEAAANEVEDTVTEAPKDYRISTKITFYIYQETQVSANGNVRAIDALRNKSWIPLDANGNLAPTGKQIEFLDLETLTPTRRNECELLEFLMIISGVSSRNSKLNRDNKKVMDNYPIALLDDPTLEEPVLDALVAPRELCPDQATLDILFDINSSAEEQQAAYNQVIGYYKALCAHINNLSVVNTIKIARGMEKGNDGKVYPTLYTRKFSLPGANTGTYSTAKAIVKDIENTRKYALSQGKDFPFYFPATLEVERWSGNDALLGGGAPNTGVAKPGANPNVGRPQNPGVPRPGFNPNMAKNPNI